MATRGSMPKAAAGVGGLDGDLGQLLGSGIGLMAQSP